MASRIQGITIEINGDTTNLQKSIRDVTSEGYKLRAELKDIDTALRLNPDSIVLIEQKTVNLINQIENTEKALEKLKDAQKQVNEQFEKGEISETVYNNFNREIEITEGTLIKLNTKLDTQIDKMNGVSTGFGKANDNASIFAETLKSNILSDLILDGLRELGDLAFTFFKDSIESAVDFESAFAGVNKTIEVTPERFEEITDSIKDMSLEIPKSVEELSAIAEMGGQLGVLPKNIESFTSTIADLSETTNLGAEEGSAMLAQFANITGMDQGKYNNLGSSIVALGNNSATTESSIAEMAQRIAGAGNQAGMSEGDILGISAALSSVGINAEAGGSAISKLILRMTSGVDGFDYTNNVLDNLKVKMNDANLTFRDMELLANRDGVSFKAMAQDMLLTSTELKSIIGQGQDLEDFATVVGVTGEEFKEAFEEDSAVALSSFITGLGESNALGDTTIQMLNDMGITEIRLRDTILRSSSASELFNDSIALGNSAFEENTALQKEAATRYETTASKMEIAKNAYSLAAATIGEELLPVVADMATAFADFVQENPEKLEALGESIANLAIFVVENGDIILGVVGAIGAILTGGKIVGAISSVTSVATAFGSVATAGTVASAGATVAAGAIGLLASPATVAVGALAAGAYALSQDVLPAVDLFANEMTTNSQGIVTSFTTIDDATKEVVNSVVYMAEESENELTTMYATATELTDENTMAIEEDFNNMKDTIIGHIEDEKTDVISNTEAMFADTNSITKDEQDKIIKMYEEHYQEQEDEVQETNDRILEILDTAKEEKRALTADENAELNDLYLEQKENAIKAVTDSQIEQEVILNNLKNSSETITADMVGNAIAEMERQKNETIATAEEERDEKVRLAETMKNELGDEATETADKLIEEANRQYDEVVEAAESTKSDGIDRLTDAYGDMSNDISYETGEILSYLDRLRNWWDSWWPEPKTVTIDTQSSGSTTYSGSTSRSIERPSQDAASEAMPDMNIRATRSVPLLKTSVDNTNDIVRSFGIVGNSATTEEATGYANHISSNQTADITITMPVTLDGKVIAESTSKYQYNFNKNNLRLQGGVV